MSATQCRQAFAGVPERGQRHQPAARSTATGDDRSCGGARRPASANDARACLCLYRGSAAKRANSGATAARPCRASDSCHGPYGPGATDVATAGGHPPILPVGLPVALPRRSARRSRRAPLLATQFRAALAELSPRCGRSRRNSAYRHARPGYHCTGRRSDPCIRPDTRAAKCDQVYLPPRFYEQLPRRGARRTRGSGLPTTQRRPADAGLQDLARRNCRGHTNGSRPCGFGRASRAPGGAAAPRYPRTDDE